MQAGDKQIVWGTEDPTLNVGGKELPSEGLLSNQDGFECSRNGLGDQTAAAEELGKTLMT